MHQAIGQSTGEALGTEHRRQVFQRQVGGDRRPAALVPLRENFEQKFGTGRRPWHIAKLVPSFSKAKTLSSGPISPRRKRHIAAASLAQFVSVDEGGAEVLARDVVRQDAKLKS